MKFEDEGMNLDPAKMFGKSLAGQMQGQPGCLLAKIGKVVYPVGKSHSFKAESDGILYFGPFESGDYSDNYGFLSVEIEVKSQ